MMTPRTWRLLVADREADIRNVVEDLLIDQGFEVHKAANVEAAVLELQHGVFDILLCHVELLRSGDGQLGCLIRQLKPPLRVVAMSASGERARSTEAATTVAKPFTRSRLLEALRPSS